MAITDYSQTCIGNVTIVTVTSDITPGAGETVYYFWFADGAFIERTVSPSKSFMLPAGDQVQIIAQDTTTADYDPIANAPSGHPARRSIWWVRSIAADVDRYAVQQKKGAGSWGTIAIVPHVDHQWSYSELTPRLDDLATYEWRVLPIDGAGNEGTAISLGPEKVVRTPDAPDFEISFDEPTTRVTFSEAA